MRVGRAKAVEHHRRPQPCDGIVLPPARVAGAARPSVEAEAVALVPVELSLVAVAREQALRTPGIDAPAFHVVVDEGAFIAVAARPGLHAHAVLLAEVEFSRVLRDPRGPAPTFGLSVHAAALVGALQLLIRNLAARLGLHGKRDREERDDECEEPSVEHALSYFVSHFSATPEGE